MMKPVPCQRYAHECEDQVAELQERINALEAEKEASESWSEFGGWVNRAEAAEAALQLFINEWDCPFGPLENPCNIPQCEALRRWIEMKERQ